MSSFQLYVTVIFLCCFPVLGRAQKSLSGAINPSLVIQSIVAFDLTSNSSPTVTFTNGADYTNDYTVSNFNTISVKSNLPWNLYISSATANFSNSGVNSTPVTPASILQYAVEGKNNKVVLSTTSQLLNSGSPGNNSAPGNRFTISFTAKPGYNYGPGTYTISTVYTITAQ
ncbi:MAG: hypothetical protein WKF97_24935 [Chitinophagaceae bacterium]